MCLLSRDHPPGAYNLSPETSTPIRHNGHLRPLTIRRPRISINVPRAICPDDHHREVRECTDIIKKLNAQLSFPAVNLSSNLSTQGIRAGYVPHPPKNPDFSYQLQLQCPLSPLATFIAVNPSKLANGVPSWQVKSTPGKPKVVDIRVQSWLSK
jgi:hypothetical protein